MKRYWLALLMLLATLAGTRAQAPLPSLKKKAPPPKSETIQVVGEEVYHGNQWSHGPVETHVVPTPPPQGGYGAPSGCWSTSAGYSDPRPNAWFSAEYLLWWVRSGRLPSLAGQTSADQFTTGGTTIQNIRSLIGGPGPSGRLDFNEQSGVRISGGTYFDGEGLFGIDASFFQLEQGDDGALVTSAGDTVIGPTFFDPVQDRNIIVLASLPPIPTGPLAPGLRRGSVAVQAHNRLWGAEMNLRQRIPALFFADQLDLLLGFRHLQYGEGFTVTTHTEGTAANPTALVIDTRDSFTALNQFWGPQLGFASKTFIGERITLDLIAKLAMGGVHQVVNINGMTTLTGAGFPGTPMPGGILAQRTNSGRRARDQFTILPEFTINAGVRVTRNAIVKVGYNLIYIGRVQRVGEQVDDVDARGVQALANFDPTVTPNVPRFKRSAHSRFWAQGLNVVLEVTY